jgi:reductive dehalogenase
MGAVDWGGAVWKGTPEENLRMLRAALRVYGGRDLGVIPLDQDTQKLIWRVEDDYIPYVFENVPKGYQTGPIYKTASSMVAHRFDHYQANSPETDYCDMKEKRVIPNSKQMYIVTWTSQESPELHKHGSSPAGGSSFYVAYGDGREQTNRLQAFITGLGYEALASVMYNQLTNNTITNILAGNLELSRMAVTGLSPVFGSAIRGWSLITDLPLAPTHPIDAGIFRFCKTCGICAKNCPSESLSQDTEPTWDAPPQEYHKAGNKVFWWDGFKCFGWWLHGASACYLCNGVCPFTNRGEASIHDLVKFASATTPILNGFFASMDEVFDMTYRKKNYLGSDLLGDGAKGQPSVWDIEIPEKGYNSSRNVPGW